MSLRLLSWLYLQCKRTQCKTKLSAHTVDTFSCQFGSFDTFGYTLFIHMWLIRIHILKPCFQYPVIPPQPPHTTHNYCTPNDEWRWSRFKVCGSGTKPLNRNQMCHLNSLNCNASNIYRKSWSMYVLKYSGYWFKTCQKFKRSGSTMYTFNSYGLLLMLPLSYRLFVCMIR